jgi:hypothetical protein
MSIKRADNRTGEVLSVKKEYPEGVRYSESSYLPG